MIESTVALAKETGEVFCSGVAISETHVMTAAHCVPEERIVYAFTEGNRPPVLINVTKRDEALDIAIFEVPGVKFKPARLGDSNNVKRGDQVFAVGHTLGELEFSFTVGYVAHPNRIASFLKLNPFIQYSLEMRGGNSGGPIFNAAGELIAIHTMSDTKGISFGVPINLAKR
jgi:S1-C subfamily serine protease